ncbi:universal stress protein [Rhodobacterales bacterium LSUCC0031]|nr:universal stress protein [Rhodobacterales bacterium LSUCC0031]
MAYKSILTILTEPNDIAAVLTDAITFAEGNGAHLEVLCLGIDRTQTGYYFAGATALVHEETILQAQSEAHAIEQEARKILERSAISWGLESMVAQSASISGLVARRSRFADLVILPKPYGKDKYADAPVIPEAAMFQGNVPVMILGGQDALMAKPDRVVVAWNESPEAMIAVRHALPLLQAAKDVDICIIAPERHSPDVADPGAELSRMLSRHGVKVSVSIIAQTLPRVSEVIARHIADTDADLLVMGAYGHSRFREAILGGATRNMLEHATIPVFMAH